MDESPMQFFITLFAIVGPIIAGIFLGIQLFLNRKDSRLRFMAQMVIHRPLGKDSGVDIARDKITITLVNIGSSIAKGVVYGVYLEPVPNTDEEKKLLFDNYDSLRQEWKQQDSRILDVGPNEIINFHILPYDRFVGLDLTDSDFVTGIKIDYSDIFGKWHTRTLHLEFHKTKQTAHRSTIQ